MFKRRGVLQGSLDQTVGDEEGREDGRNVTLKLEFENPVSINFIFNDCEIRLSKATFELWHLTRIGSQNTLAFHFHISVLDIW